MDTNELEEVMQARIEDDASSSGSIAKSNPTIQEKPEASSLVVAAVVMSSLLLFAILMVFIMVYYKQKKNHEDMIKKVHENVELVEDAD